MDSDHRRALAHNVKRLRVAKGWSQAELARRTGIAQTAISYIERLETKSPTLETIEAIGKAFNVPCWAIILDLDVLDTRGVAELGLVLDSFLRTPEDSRQQIARTAARELEYVRSRR